MERIETLNRNNLINKYNKLIDERKEIVNKYSKLKAVIATLQQQVQTQQIDQINLNNKYNDYSCEMFYMW